MNELKCKECGQILETGSEVCSSCGCPIEKKGIKKLDLDKDKILGKFNKMALISLCLGFIIMIMGIVVINKDVVVNTHNAQSYDAEYAAFGGDFYTSIYGASDIIVDELNEINSGVAVVSSSVASAVGAIYYPIGMLIVAVGLGVVAMSCINLKKENC